MTLTRKLTAGAAAIIATLGLATLAPAEAEAAPRCNAPGKRIKSYPVTSFVNGKKIGSLDIYYSNRYRGTNIACLHHYGAAVGKPLNDDIRITRCESYYGCDHLDRENRDFRFDVYKYYAGPVQVTATRDRCVYVDASMQDPYDEYDSVTIFARNVGCAAEPEVHLQSFQGRGR